MTGERSISLPSLLRVLNFFAVELQGMQSSADGIVDRLFPGIDL
jgi:hypothetical protein